MDMTHEGMAEAVDASRPSRPRPTPLSVMRCTAFVLLSLIVATPAFGAGDAQHGASLYRSRCQSCHSVDDNEIGPRHRGVFNRRAGAVPDYAYSKALRHTQIVWTAQNLDRWLTNPEALIPGQQMNINVRDAHDRRDLIAYLMQLSTLPAP